jgi:hypothetical protein
MGAQVGKCSDTVNCMRAVEKLDLRPFLKPHPRVEPPRYPRLPLGRVPGSTAWACMTGAAADRTSRIAQSRGTRRNRPK